MTQPTGRTFLSYRRARALEAARIIQALHDHGIPTWQDVTNLASAPTEDELRRALGSPEIGSAVIFATPEVEDSAVIRKVEIPLIIKRYEAGDAFFAIPVAAGGLDYKKAAEVTSTHLSAENFIDWNMMKIAGAAVEDDDAALIADRVLAARLKAIHKAAAAGPLSVGLFVRAEPPYSADVALALNWKKRFDDREATAETWRNILLPALARIAAALRAHAPGRSIETFGFPTLPAAFALGCQFVSTSGQKLAWRQVMRGGGPEQIWTLDASREASGFAARMVSKDASASDLAILISITDDVEPVFAGLQKELPPLRALVHIRKDGAYPHAIANAGQAGDVAYVVEGAMREARRQYGNIGTVHVVMAGPAGLAVLIGQTFNTFGNVRTYELVGTDGSGRYRPAALLHPSS